MIKRVDENGNVRLITNIRKPRKWRRYEYLLSNGILWIDTGYIPNNFTKIDTKFDTHRSDSGLLTFITSYRFGDYRTTNGFHIMRYKDSSLDYDLVKVGKGWPSGVKQVKNLNIGSNSVLIDFKNKECYINGGIYTDLVDFSLVDMDLCTNTLPIFAHRINGTNEVTLSGVSLPGKIHDASVYTFKIWDNDILVRDFVPAQYNGLYGMWDLVEDKFYGNSGTGTFTVGPEIKNYDEIYEVRKTFSLLPAGVELYDSLKFSYNSNTYIETGLTPTSTTEYKLSFKPYSTTWAIFGASTTTANGVRLFYNGHLYAGFGANRSENTTTITANATHIVTYKKTQLTIDSTNYSVGLGTSFPITLSIGRDLTWENGIHGLNGEVHYFQIYDNNILIRNFLPCTYLGEPGMWDTVENKFYRNQGTGLFTLGNKITLKEYEYLLMQGTYINTGITPNLDTRVLAELLLYDNTLTAVFGSRITTSGNCGSFMVWNGTNDGFAFLYGHNAWDLGKFAIAPTANTRFTIDLNKNVGTLSTGSTKVYNYHTFSSNCTFVIGSTNTSGTVDNRYTKENIYYFKMYSNGKLVRDYVPVSYNGTPGLWDKVEWKFYANTGSGSFTLGPEKKSGIFPISFGTLEYSEGSNISSSLLTVTGSGKTSTPVRAANNACTSGYKVEFSNVSVAKTYVIELDFTWAGNWGFTSDGNPRLFFLGTTKVSGGSYEWKGTNYITVSLNNRKSLLGLVQSSPSGGKYHYIGVFTIPANDRVGYSIETRCDYSDGNGSFTYGNLKIYSYN